jgi:cysteine desulfurase
MSRIYLDNAATTSVDPLVLEAMLPYFSNQYGNPNSIHSYGRETRIAIEKARKEIALLLQARPGELFFTSCGTESTNTVLHAAIRDLGCRHIITSAIEHHATLHTAEFLESLGLCRVSKVKLTQDGHLDYIDLEHHLSQSTEKTIVSLMHANNEIGNISDIQFIGDLCKRYNAYFHTDAVQTMGHFPLGLEQIPVDFLSASAHKFHGPKGSGLLYIKSGINLKPFIHGGSQERNMRSGTENVANIVGFAKALELSLLHHHEDKVYISSLKQSLAEQLRNQIPSIHFHGDISEKSLYTVLNAGFALNDKTEMLSINLDVAGIAVSGGSACSSGAQGGSHVIKAVYPHENRVPVRFSFSKHNTFEELETAVNKIIEFLT